MVQAHIESAAVRTSYYYSWIRPLRDDNDSSIIDNCSMSKVEASDQSLHETEHGNCDADCLLRFGNCW